MKRRRVRRVVRLEARTDTIVYVKLACGKHWADPSKKQADDPCAKCKIHAAERARGVLQHNGTPWIVLLGDPLKQKPGDYPFNDWKPERKGKR